MVVDAIAAELGSSGAWRPRFNAEVVSLIPAGLVLVKPMSFMNESGVPLQAVAGFFKIPAERCLVICDDLDQPYGKLRMRMAGGHGGQNGLRSIIGTMGEKFPRLRVGIGRDRNTSENAVVSRVLGRFSSDEQPLLPDVLAAAKTGALAWHREGVDPAMRFINTWGVPENAQTTD
jgi:PTH1 family peptidyl-tRNA hydrolase